MTTPEARVRPETPASTCTPSRPSRSNQAPARPWAPASPSRSIALGDRIAQLLLVRLELPATVEVDELPGSERGDGGFGSNGR